MTFPTPYVVQYWEHTPGGPDPHRNPATYSPPLDQPGRQVRVYGWAIPSTAAPNTEGHPDRVTADGDVYAPATFVPPPRSVIGLPQGRFEVVGEVQDYNHGPFGWQPGNVVNIRRVVG